MSRLYSFRPRPILRTFLFAVSCLLLLTVASAPAQTFTTGNLGGTVKDAQGGALPGATVVAGHTATGTKYETVSDAEGRFDILNVRVGTYDVLTELTGFRQLNQTGVEVALGEREFLDVRLQIAAVTETVEVISEPTIIDSSVAGTGANVSNAVKEVLPTI